MGKNLDIFQIFQQIIKPAQKFQMVSLELLTCALEYFRTTVCPKVSEMEISTFYNYFNQSRNSTPFEISELVL